MYVLTSSAGLNTTTMTIEQVAVVFAQHLHDMGRDGPIHWKITTPAGNFLTGHVRLTGAPDNGFINQTVQEIRADLQDEAQPADLTV